MIFFKNFLRYVYKKEYIKGFLEIDIGRYSLKDEFFQSVHSIILKVNLSAGVCFQTTLRRRRRIVYRRADRALHVRQTVSLST